MISVAVALGAGRRGKMRSAVSIVIALEIVLGIGRAWSADSPTLEERAAAIERASTEPDGDRVVVGHLSRKLDISADTLRRQRTQTGLGWGDLLIANRLSRETGLSFDQIVAEFRGGKSWGEIGRDHNVDVVKLTGEVQASQEAIEQRSEDKGPHTGAVDKPAGRSGGSGRTGSGRNRR
jgi:hypothetical protein